MFDFIKVPFGWVLGKLYELTGNYGWSMIIFGIIVQLVLLPITMKTKKSSMKMSRIQPRIQEIQRKYANDPAKQQEAMRALQREEGVSMGCGGCLWSLIPLLILIPLYDIIRNPLTYLMSLDGDTVSALKGLIDGMEGIGFNSKDAYFQVKAAQLINSSPELFAGIQGLGSGINFGFLGVNLGMMPQWQVWASTFVWGWPTIGLALIPILSAGMQVVQMLISQKMNRSVVTNEKGLQDKEAADNSQAAKTGKMMIYMMPIMSLLIGFGVPGALSLYWLVGGVCRTIEDVVLTKHYRKKYDAEDAERLKRTLALEAEEAEKERIRAEKRAANPDGITQNTSKKKLQQKQREEQQAAKAVAAKEYAAKKGLPVEEEPVKQTLSGIPDRPYCKGRAYQADRYASDSTEE